jgi:KDO2-lipid IV(A) lauroyltransferase
VELLLLAIAILVARVPFARLRPLGAVLGWIAGTVVRIRRRHVVASLAGAGFERADAVADGMYRALGVGVFEFLWLAGRPRQRLESIARLTPPAVAALRAADRRGRGIVIAGSHTGNWELAACAIAEQRELLVIAKRLSVGAFDRFARRVRAGRGVRLADPEGALVAGQATLARRGIVTMLVDQVPEDSARALDVPFLGRPARVDRAAAVLAWRTRAPLIVTAARRAEDGSLVIDVLTTLEAPEGAERAWVDSATRAVTRALEAFVRAYPTEWLWLHRRWKGCEPIDGWLAEPNSIR